MIILMYHGVVPDIETDPVLSYGQIHASGFEWQMRWLQNNAVVVSLADAITAIQIGQKLPSRATVLTFDDGFQNNFEIAFPILEKYQLPATFFVSVAHLEPGHLLWFNMLLAKTYVDVQLHGYDYKWSEYLEDLQKQFLNDMISDEVILRYGNQAPSEISQTKINNTLAGMTREQLRQVAQSHWVEIGSHTLTHPRLTQCAPDRLKKELGNSKKELEGITHKPVRFLAYPQGDFNTSVIQTTQQAGYISALGVDLTTNPHQAENLFCLPRIGIYNENIVYFLI